MRDHDSGATLTLTADDLDAVITGLLTGDRDALILADALNKRWRKAVDALKPCNWKVLGPVGIADVAVICTVHGETREFPA